MIKQQSNSWSQEWGARSKLNVTRRSYTTRAKLVMRFHSVSISNNEEYCQPQSNTKYSTINLVRDGDEVGDAGGVKNGVQEASST
mmetsp:Transcript_24436/g.35487  ORF Transcript_24436/g.35487 Transcript_24436/m.35487 type:complete len:85 (+) Transcript_24436:281-535(+)